MLRVSGAEGEADSRKRTFAYSFQAVPSTTRGVPLSSIRRGPSSISAPSKEEHPGPPFSLLRTEKGSALGEQEHESVQLPRLKRAAPDDQSFSLWDVLVSREQEVQVRVAVGGRSRWGRVGRGGDVAAVEGQAKVAAW